MTLDHVIKRIAIFGSTGSVGIQTLKVITTNTDKFSIEILTTNTNDELLTQQTLKHNPNIIIINNENKYTIVKKTLSTTNIKIFTKKKSLEKITNMNYYDLILTAIVSFANLRPTLKAINTGKAIA